MCTITLTLHLSVRLELQALVMLPQEEVGISGILPNQHLPPSLPPSLSPSLPTFLPHLEHLCSHDPDIGGLDEGCELNLVGAQLLDGDLLQVSIWLKQYTECVVIHNVVGSDLCGGV